MTDIIGALNRKKTALLNHRKSIELEARTRTIQIDAKIEAIDRALALINDAVADYLCPVCNGTGCIRKPDAAGQMEDQDCPACHGTGVSEARP